MNIFLIYLSLSPYQLSLSTPAHRWYPPHLQVPVDHHPARVDRIDHNDGAPERDEFVGRLTTGLMASVEHRFLCVHPRGHIARPSALHD